MNHFNVRTLMIAVVVIAINLSVGIALWRLDKTLLCRIAVIGMAMQFGLVRLIQGRGRPFWGGYVAAAAALISASSFLVFPPQFAGGAPPVFGPAPAPTYPGSVMWRAWDRYDRFTDPLWAPVYSFFDQAEFDPLSLRVQAAAYASYALVASLPQLAIALLCGLATQAAVRLLSSRPPSPLA
ncbi:hypothetical protein AB1L88_11870 [Tautonia sp. JC769]|uniref:hypothetical protein n=1 Tax=Tautonia sp. JC769 TaxID=3232135 RepID=UPI0034597597